MKHRKLTFRHKKFLKSIHCDPDNWMLERDTADVTVYVHKHTGTLKSFSKKVEVL